MPLSMQEKKALAGLGVIAAFVGASLYEIGRRNFWFESKNTYYTDVVDADGLRVGSLVTLSGLHIGEVTNMDVTQDNHIRLELRVKKSVAGKIREDSVATFVRALVIGEKRVDVSPGTQTKAPLKDGGTIQGHQATELIDFITGRKLADLMTTIESLIAGLNSAVGKYENGEFNGMLAKLEPALDNFVRLSSDMIIMTSELKKRSKDLPVIIGSSAQVMSSVNDDFLKNGLAKGVITQTSGTMTKLSNTLTQADMVLMPLAKRQKLMEGLLDNLADLSHELKKNPDYGSRMLEAISELTVTLKALQHTWFLEDQAQQARKNQPTPKQEAPAE